MKEKEILKALWFYDVNNVHNIIINEIGNIFHSDTDVVNKTVIYRYELKEYKKLFLYNTILAVTFAEIALM